MMLPCSASRIVGSRAVAASVLVIVGFVSAPPAIAANDYRLYAAPRQLTASCQRAARHVAFVVLCPTALPRARDGTAPRTFAQWADYPKDVVAPWVMIGATYGTEGDPFDWAGNSPQWFFHFFLLEGKLTPKLLNLAGVPHPQRLVGQRTIAGHTGNLYTQVSYSVCSECSFTGHLTFVWRENAITYAASLHRWSPKVTRGELALLGALVTRLHRS